jgi:hypothetical protein
MTLRYYISTRLLPDLVKGILVNHVDLYNEAFLGHQSYQQGITLHCFIYTVSEISEFYSKKTSLHLVTVKYWYLLFYKVNSCQKNSK